MQDKLREWTQRFSSLGVKCQEFTSDSGSTNVLDMLDTDIILATPEVIFFPNALSIDISLLFLSLLWFPYNKDESIQIQKTPEVTWRHILIKNVLDLRNTCSSLLQFVPKFNILQAAYFFAVSTQKFDVMSRRHRDRGGMSFFGDIALLLIDEVHLLSETRGAALEAVVSRLKMLARFPEIKGCPLSTIRFVAVSATISNIEDLGDI